VVPRTRLDWYGKFRPPPGLVPRTLQPVRGRHNDCAIKDHRVVIRFGNLDKFRQ